MAVLGVSFPVICVLLVCIARDVFDYSLSTCLPSSNILCNIILQGSVKSISALSVN